MFDDLAVDLGHAPGFGLGRFGGSQETIHSHQIYRRLSQRSSIFLRILRKKNSAREEVVTY